MKKRILFLALAPLAVALMALAVLGGGHTEARQTPPPSAPAVATNQSVCESDAGAANEECGYPVYECFWILKYSGSGATPNTWVTLDTYSYGPDRVYVTKPAWMCESGYKYRTFGPDANGVEVEGQGSYTKIYACFYLTGGDNIYETAGLWTDNFGTDPVLIRNSQIMCERAKKTHESAVTGSLEDGPDASGGYGSKIWQCFNLNALPHLNIFGISTNNFGWQRILSMNGFQLCEDAQKTHGSYVGGSTSGNIRECFRIEQMNPYWLPQWVSLETNNFGSFEALIGRPMMMCERAEWSRQSPP